MKVNHNFSNVKLVTGEGLSRGSHSFKFENMWLKAEGFVDMVKQLWDSYKFLGTPCFILANKLKRLKLDLKRWNKEVFDKIEGRKKSLLEVIQSLDYLEEERSLEEEEKVRRAKAKVALLHEVS